MSKPYRPANGTEGAFFINEFCDRCWNDRNEDCPILAASFAGQVEEWIQDDDYTHERCTAFTIKEPKELPADAKAQLPLDLYGGRSEDSLDDHDEGCGCEDCKDDRALVAAERIADARRERA